ncbi:MAG TPA: aminotransferase class I/II-fold pyridoxal phosphate-dependent enzyme [Candidatus Marinimicrobia bacterium]|nr:aminotransferase class I/II-fold pyridoxal phosphate-dependent enzyme [Candidatus Neomarinimicrobiota bacterium]HRS51547.1 aminotransferase class I/II-fold pyridoxal phosphate-dependent enzyme [Candidatus Neomarinimicrobiota bacterium]HRU92925.1 aminotransferase class I/II-fold pyridoxal phosphate-dependent enzyme [Candidatus Neomarinimicrobiota bacterium]
MNPKIIPARRTEKVTYAIRDIVVKAKQLEDQGKKITYLNIGDPPVYDFETPLGLRQIVAEKILQSNANAKLNVSVYSDSMGVTEAREAVARYATEKKGIKGITASDVFMANGASEAITLAIAALIDPGDNIMTPSPGYPLYSGQIPVYHGKLNPYLLNESTGWQIDFDELEKRVNKRTKAIVVINPNNPTGANYNRESLLNVINFARRHNLVIFADEIYDKLLLDSQTHTSIASLAEDVPVITFGGLSKNYIMPGWRVGWAIFSDPTGVMADYHEAVNKLLRARLCAVHPQQYMVAPALDGDDSHLPQVIQKLTGRRDITYKMLNDIPGVSCVKPEAAFYAFPRIQLPQGVTDEQFVLELLNETGVLVVYGSGFGQKPGTKHFRVVFLPDENILRQSYTLIGEFTAKFYRKYNFKPK